MFKSTLDKVSEDTPLVTSACIGHRVLLANSDNEIAASGTLRFVGELEGQNGVFCGVELTGPYGKNDGSYKGESFFRCPPKHGLFLPIHRVRLAEKLTLPKRVVRPDRLIHSATNTFDLNSSVTSSDMDNMDGSRLSTTSYNNWMDTSSDDDMDMTDSHFTYNVTRPQYLLQEVEDPQPLISIDEDWTQFHADSFSNGNINTSYVVTNPTMDRRDLPVIGTPTSVADDATPLVEENPINGNFVIQSSNDSLNDAGISEVNDPEALINMDSADESPPNEQDPPVPKEDQKKKSSPGANGHPKTTSPKPPVEKKEPKPTKVRMTLREMINAPPKPVHVERPKKVNKQQQLMEQILANKKEHKDVPKKQVRSRLSDLWAAPPAGATPKAENKKATSKVAATTKPMSSVKNLPATPKIEAKSKIDTGVRLRATPNKVAAPNRASAPILAGRPVSSTCPKTPKTPLTQNASTSRNNLAPNSKASTMATPEARKRLRQLPKLTNLEKKLLMLCHKYVQQTTVLGLIISSTANSLDTAEFKGTVANTTVASQKEEIALLAESVKQLEGTYKEQIRVLQQGHTDQINNLEETYNNRIQTLEKVHETELQKHTKHIEQLQESLNIEKEKVEDLRKAFDKTTDEKVQVLNEEIRSLNVMLNIRNEEIRQLHKDIESEKLVIEKYQLAEKEASNKLQEYEHDASNYKKVVDENRRLRSELNKAVHEVEVLKSNLNSKDSVIQLYTQRVECLEAARGRPDGQREHMIFDDETY